MPAQLCKTHYKPYPCGKCRIENAKKPAQAPPVTVVSPHRADAKPAPKGSVTPEIHKQIDQSLAPAPTIEKAVVTQQIESSHGTKIVSAEEDRVPDPDHIAENADAALKRNTRVPTQPRRGPSKQPGYLKSVAHPIVRTSDPNAPFGRDENYRPIVPGRSDQKIAADLRDKSYLAPGDCPHKRNSEFCLLCGTANYRTRTEIEPESRPGLELIEEALRLTGMRKQVVYVDEFEYFPEILGITRRELVGLLDLPVGTEPREVNRKQLKSRSGIENAIAELTTVVPARIEELKNLIRESEQLIESWSARVMKLRRAEEDILDKPTREKFKRDEKKNIDAYEQEQRELQKRLPHLAKLRQRLDVWGSLPEDYETVTTTEYDVVTFRDKFELSKRYLEDRPGDSIENYFVVLTEYWVLRDESRRFRNFPAIDQWRYFENEIIFQAIRFGLVQPTIEAIKKYPTLDRSTTGRPEHGHDDPENQLIIKTGGAEIGASIYGAGTAWNGRQRGLSSFDRPSKYGGGGQSESTSGDFYGMDSGDFGAEE